MRDYPIGTTYRDFEVGTPSQVTGRSAGNRTVIIYGQGYSLPGESEEIDRLMGVRIKKPNRKHVSVGKQKGHRKTLAEFIAEIDRLDWIGEFPIDRVKVAKFSDDQYGRRRSLLITHNHTRVSYPGSFDVSEVEGKKIECWELINDVIKKRGLTYEY